MILGADSHHICINTNSTDSEQTRCVATVITGIFKALHAHGRAMLGAHCELRSKSRLSRYVMGSATRGMCTCRTGTAPHRLGTKTQ